MADTITVRGMKLRANRFLKSNSLETMARLLLKPPLHLLSLASNPEYDEFYIPKKNGDQRQIEDPLPALKKVQRKLNDYFQAVYHFCRTDAAYGFLTNPVDDPQPRHILSNAQQHIGCQWMLNVDMKDFFHLIDQERIEQLFDAPIFNFKESLSKMLAALCTYKGRLPMGAPTSPILSNFVSIPLDQDFQDFATERGWTYTRYADDMTFSGPTEITRKHIQEINERVEAYGFMLNPNKIKLYGPNQENKEVTGLIVAENRVDLSEEYLTQLTKAIEKLDQVMNVKYSVPSGRRGKTTWLEELELQIRGKLEFARQILGEDDLMFQDLALQMEEALMPPEQYGPINWLDFGYLPPK